MSDDTLIGRILRRMREQRYSTTTTPTMQRQGIYEQELTLDSLRMAMEENGETLDDIEAGIFIEAKYYYSATVGYRIPPEKQNVVLPASDVKDILSRLPFFGGMIIDDVHFFVWSRKYVYTIGVVGMDYFWDDLPRNPGPIPYGYRLWGY